MPVLRVAACQIDPVMGDLDGNAQRILETVSAADRAGCDLAVFPELAVSGYPPEDLVLKPGFVRDNLAILEEVARSTAATSCAAVIGFVEPIADEAERRSATAGLGRVRHPALHDAAAVVHGGTVRGVYRKQLLPNYAVFDEQRYFQAGGLHQPHFVVGGVAVAVLICEDLWFPQPAIAAAEAGAGLIVSPNGSPFYRGRLEERIAVMSTRAIESTCPVVYVNQVGGQDELVFDGASMVIAADGTTIARSPQFAEDLLVVDIEVPAVSPAVETLPAPGRIVVTDTTRSAPPRGEPAPLAPLLSPEEEVYRALVLGTRDYVRKNGFSDVVIAMSGGIDSTLVAVIAADALGPDRVHGVAMPSRYSSEGSVRDAQEVADKLGIELRVVPIEEVHTAYLKILECDEAGGVSLAHENLQSRIRGVTIMFLSNRNGWLVLTTGNKSELAVGYSTLYGDTAGGFAVIKDVPKTMVYELCHFRNRIGEVIPRSVIDKPPSAELRPDQRDDQSLPPYEVLDPVLMSIVEEDETAPDLIARGLDPAVAVRMAHLVDIAEYKRRQNPPGVRVTPKAFGKDRRIPITNRYRGRSET